MEEKAFIRSKKYWISVAIATILSYGFMLTNYSIGVDDESFYGYFQAHGLLSQGRYGSEIVNSIFKISEFIPFWVDFIAVIILIISVCIWCYTFETASKGKFSINSCIVFSCILISFPNMAHIFIFMMASIQTSIVILISGLAIFILYKYMFESSNKKYIFISIILLSFGVSFLETTLVLYLMGFFALMLICLLNHNLDLKFIIKNVALIIVIMVSSLLLYKVTKEIMLHIYDVAPSQYTSNYILYKKGDFINQIKVLIKSLSNLFVENIFNDIVSFSFCISSLVLIIISTYTFIRKGNFNIIISIIGLFISSIAMYIITGNLYLPLRIMFTLCLFIAFVLSYTVAIIRDKNKILKYVALFLTFIIVFYQTKEINKIFYADYIRYQLDLQKTHQIAYDIEKYTKGDIEKPIALIGTPKKYQLQIKDPLDSIYRWDRAWNLETENYTNHRIFSFFKMVGYNMKIATNYQIKEAEFLSNDMKSWPREGSIREFDDFIIIKLGEQDK